VLISRAKHRCEVFSSITDEDIDLERARGKGVFAFKLFLQFARTGRLSSGTRNLSAKETQFEIEIAKALQERGYQVHSHIGIAGCFIDLAVADPAQPGRYLLGIECDGASYRQARSARDRDRLRKSVLEDHGWIMHRVWCSDWFQRPQEELSKAIAAIESAKVELESRAHGAAQKRAVPVKVITVERTNVIEIGLVAEDEVDSFSLPYVEARNIKPIRGVQLHDAPLETMMDYVKRVVAIEGPVHTDEVVTRIRAGWDLARSGARIQTAVEAGVQLAVRAKHIDNVDGFLSLPGEPVKVRDRSSTESTGLRRPEMLPPAEVDRALLDVAKRNLGAKRSELVQRTCRTFGFKAAGATLRELIERRIAILLDGGQLIDRDGLLTAT
jgi:very-short-patch-repair endonuclease